MARLEKRKHRSVVETIATDTEDLDQLVRVTFSMRKRDVEELEDFIRDVRGRGELTEIINKSVIVRKALKLLYKSNIPLNTL